MKSSIFGARGGGTPGALAARVFCTTGAFSVEGVWLAGTAGAGASVVAGASVLAGADSATGGGVDEALGAGDVSDEAGGAESTGAAGC